MKTKLFAWNFLTEFSMFYGREQFSFPSIIASHFSLAIRHSLGNNVMDPENESNI